MQGTLTYDQDIQDLPEDDNDTGNNSNDQPAPAGPLVTLLSLNTHAASIPLTRNKTILGRVAGNSHFLLFLFNLSIQILHIQQTFLSPPMTYLLFYWKK